MAITYLSGNNRAVRFAASVVFLAATATLLTSVYFFFVYALFSAVTLGGISAAYLLVAGCVWKRPINAKSSASSVVAAGLALALIESANLIAEHFLALRPPANASVPASAMGLMVLCFATPAALGSSNGGIIEGTLAAIATAALGMTVSCSIGVVLIGISAHATDRATASRLVAQTVANATMHMVVPLAVAAVVGFVAGVTTFLAQRFTRSALLALSIGAALLIFAGVQLLVTASGLPRSERPGLVALGMLLCASGLATAPSLFVASRPPSTATA